MHLRRQRAARLSPVQQTTSLDHRPEIGKNIAYQANREGVAERVDDAAVQQTIAVDFARITYADERLRDLELSSIQTAKQPDANPRHRRQTVPGMGNILSLVRLYAIPHLDRFPRVQDVASSGRLVTCAQASAGKRLGTSGKNIDHAHLTWASSEAAVLCLRHKPPRPNIPGALGGQA